MSKVDKVEPTDAYLDILTTGIFTTGARILVIGFYLVNKSGNRLVQLIGEEITEEKILMTMDGVNNLFTYNGTGFALPYISSYLGVYLSKTASHHDLMRRCWQYSIRGNQQNAERQLGIPRYLEGITHSTVIELWQKYCEHGDKDALSMVLKYNKENVVNLRVIREKLLTMK